MKTLPLLLLAAIASLSFYGCKKSNSTNNNISTSTWTLDGVKYTATGTHYANPVLISADDNSNDVSIFFNAKPTTGGDFAIRAISPSVSNECSIIVSTAADSYFSTDGGTAHVTVSSSGKLTVTFSNVITYPLGTSVEHTLSGTVVEQ